MLLTVISCSSDVYRGSAMVLEHRYEPEYSYSDRSWAGKYYRTRHFVDDEDWIVVVEPDSDELGVTDIFVNKTTYDLIEDGDTVQIQGDLIVTTP